MPSGTGPNYSRRIVIMMGKFYPSAKAASEALEVDYACLKNKMHFWRFADCPPWFVEILEADSGKQEMIDASIAKTAAAARRLYDLKFRIIQDDYDKKMADLNYEYRLLLDDNDKG